MNDLLLRSVALWHEYLMFDDRTLCYACRILISILAHKQGFSMAIDRRSQFTLQMMVKATQIYTTLLHVMETGRTTDINMEGSAICSDDDSRSEKTWLNLMLLHDEPGTEAVWPCPGGGVDTGVED